MPYISYLSAVWNGRPDMVNTFAFTVTFTFTFTFTQLFVCVFTACSCTEKHKDLHHIAYDSIHFGLCPNVKLDLFFPGFPTLKHLKHEVNKQLFYLLSYNVVLCRSKPNIVKYFPTLKHLKHEVTNTAF